MSRPCTVCSHPERSRIEMVIGTGEANTRIAAKFGLKEQAIRYHKKNHLPAKVAKATAARERLDADKILEVMEALLYEGLRAVKDAREMGDHNAKIRAIDTTTRTGKALLEANGKIQNGTQVNVGVVNQTQILASPDWSRIVPVLLTYVDEHFGPADREALSARIRALAGGSS